MTINTEISRSGPYAGAGTTGPFLVNFRILDAAHLRVVKLSAGVESTLAYPADYLVTGVGNPTSSLATTVAILAGETLTIIRDVPKTQEADYVQNDDFPAQSHEDALDKLTMIVQQIGETVDRSLTLPVSAAAASTELPTPQSNAIIGWNQTATALQNIDPTTLATIVAFGTAKADVFTGTGAQTVFTLTASPGTQANLDVAIGGVTQLPGTDYTWISGTTLTFTTAPPNGVKVLARYMIGLPQGYTTADQVGFDSTLSFPVGTVGRRLTDIAAAGGAGLVGFSTAVNYAVGTIGWHTQPYISVTDFMTQAELTDFLSGNPSLDFTAACNRATQSTLAFTNNADAPKRRIYMPAGNWNIAGPVYVRKGQQIEGAGMGATRITQSPAAVVPIFKMGYGLISGVETPDPGGLAPHISSLHVNSSSASVPAIDTGNAAGFRLTDLFLTNVGVGIGVTGGDGVIDGCIIDQGLIGISVGASQNVVISNCIFYLLNYQLRVATGASDLQVNNCHFEYMQYAGVYFDDSATVKNTSVSSCQFISNSQYGTFLGHVHTRATAVDATFIDCKFRNMWGFAFTHATGIGGDFTFSNCVFDGNKTVTAYSQSTNAGGVSTQNETVRLINCQFKNLPQGAVASSGTFAGTVEVVGGSYSGIGTSSAIVLSNSSASHFVSLRSIRGDNVTPLVNAQGVHSVELKNNVDWLGASAVASSRTYWRVPYTGDPLLAVVTVQASTNVGANILYRKNSRYIVTKSTDFSGSIIDQTSKTLLSQDAAGFAPVVDFQAEVTSVGGGASVAHSSTGGYLYFSVPVAYANVVIRVDFD